MPQRPLSCTQVGMFMRCPAQYEFRYLYDIKMAPSGAMMLGSAYHNTLADMFSQRMQDKDSTTERIQDVFATQWERVITTQLVEEDGEWGQADKEIDWGEDKPDALKDMGISLATMYNSKVAPTVEKPVCVEAKTEFPVVGVPFVAIADVVTECRVVDHKVKSKRFSAEDISRELQPMAYTYVGLDRGKDFEYHVALKQRNLAIDTPSIDPKLKLKPNEGDWSWFEVIVSKIAQSIEAGVFAPNPNGWHCSPSWCGYWGICKGKFTTQFGINNVVLQGEK